MRIVLAVTFTAECAYPISSFLFLCDQYLQIANDDDSFDFI